MLTLLACPSNTVWTSIDIEVIQSLGVTVRCPSLIRNPNLADSELNRLAIPKLLVNAHTKEFVRCND